LGTTPSTPKRMNKQVDGPKKESNTKKGGGRKEREGPTKTQRVSVGQGVVLS